MSLDIDQAFVDQFRDNVIMLVQQEGSRLRGTLTERNDLTGESEFIERVGKIEPQLRTTRHQDTPLSSVPHSKRRLDLKDYELADLIDKVDELRTLIDPQSDYVRAFGMGFGRQIDRDIIDAFDADVVTKRDSSGTASFDTNNVVAVNFVESGTASNSDLTVGKLREAKRILDANEVPETDRHIAISASQLNSLLRDSEVTSTDFNSVRALVTGELDTYLGFQFHNTELLPKSGDVRDVFAWHMTGMRLALPDPPQPRIKERADKSFSTQVFMSMTIGSVRLQETAVVKIKCDETA